jgi:hypothetical protein
VSNNQRVFKPAGPVVKAFMESEAFFRGIMGPIGSGKSVTCVVEAMRRSGMFPAGPDGIRRPRGVVVRNTYPDLKETTIKTWHQWVPVGAGKMTMQPPIVHNVKMGDLDMEVLFLALDRDEDVRKLLSLEATWIWFNEVRYIPKSIVDASTGRVGRWVPYPAAKDAWAGILADTNPPDTESWYYQLAEGTNPKMIEDTRVLEDELRNMGALEHGQKLFEFFRQPSGLAENAENRENLRKGYYQFAAANKTEDYVNVYVHGNYGYVVEGKPVYPMYRDHIHAAKEPIPPIEGLPILVGADFGLTPSATFGQRLADGRWRIIAELTTDHCGPTRFAEILKAFVATHYPEHSIGGAWGDPAGTAGEEGETYFAILRRVTGWRWIPAPTNDPEIRREAVIGALNRLVEGEPGLLISPTCTVLRKGFVSGYHYKLVKSSNGAMTHETPAKNQYSHPHDSLQYLVLGGGEYDVVHARKRQGDARPRQADGTGSDPFEGSRPAPTPTHTNAYTMRKQFDRSFQRKRFADTD